MKQFSKVCSWKPTFVGGASSYLFACAFFITVLWSAKVEGQGLCAKHEELVAQLAESYGEELHTRAITDANWLFELFVSEETRTWTIIVTDPRGISCSAGSGTDWEPVPSKKGEKV